MHSMFIMHRLVHLGPLVYQILSKAPSALFIYLFPPQLFMLLELACFMHSDYYTPRYLEGGQDKFPFVFYIVSFIY